MRDVEIMQPDWDNQSGHMQAPAKDYESCHKLCLRKESCVQYRFDPVKQMCRAHSSPNLGLDASGTELRSGWLYDRIEKWIEQRKDCDSVGDWWLT